MNKSQMNLQDNFLNQARKENIPVTIYLISGVQLKGVVRGFDAFTVVLESMGKPAQLVYKHAVASVVPARPVMGLFTREDRYHEAPRERPRAQEPERPPAPAPAPPPAPEPQPAPEAEAEPEPAQEAKQTEG